MNILYTNRLAFWHTWCWWLAASHFLLCSHNQPCSDDISPLFFILQLSQGADKWVSEFSSQHNQGALNESWVDEFSKLNVTDEWAEEFSGGGFGESSADPWVDE